jgi:outer membrane protein assembly factor BamA
MFPEPAFIVRAIDFATRTMGDGGGDKSGLYAEMGNMVTGAGWISVGPGYRHWFGGDRLVADMSAAMSWRSYKMARGRIELTNLARSRIAVGSELRWQDFTQNSYFGQGPDSLELDRSEYRLKSLDAIGYTNVRPVKWMTFGGSAGWLRRPSLLEPSGRFNRGTPAMQVVFPGDAAIARLAQPDYFHSELSVTADTRDHRSHPLRGGLYRGSWARYADRDDGTFSFQRFEAEGAQFVSTDRSQVTLAVRGWLVASDTGEGHDIPFYLMPALGGNNTLRAFANYRFHDRHFAVMNVELRLALLAHVDGVMFVDAGNVATRLADLDFAKRSIGAGVRLHSGRATFARVDVAKGREGWRLTVSTSDPLHLSRLSRRTAPIPFVP